jgi:hypothetical protein
MTLHTLQVGIIIYKYEAPREMGRQKLLLLLLITVLLKRGNWTFKEKQ